MGTGLFLVYLLDGRKLIEFAEMFYFRVFDWFFEVAGPTNMFLNCITSSLAIFYTFCWANSIFIDFFCFGLSKVLFFLGFGP